MHKRICTGIFLSAFFFLVQTGSSVAVEPFEVRLTPDLVNIGATYNGGKVTVTGTVPSDAQVIVELEGEKADTTLLKKEHVFGLFWMNSGSITLEGLPEVYMLYLPGKTAGNKMETINELKQSAAVFPEDGDKAEELDEFFKLKKKEGLYAIYEDAVHYQPEAGGRKFTCEILVPAAMHRGTYTVKTSISSNGRLYAVTNDLEVKETGLPEFIRSLAFNHAFIYGIMATVIAITAGLLMSFVFRGERGVH